MLRSYVQMFARAEIQIPSAVNVFKVSEQK